MIQPIFITSRLSFDVEITAIWIFVTGSSVNTMLEGLGIPNQHQLGFETKKFDMFAGNHSHDVNV